MRDIKFRAWNTEDNKMLFPKFNQLHKGKYYVYQSDSFEKAFKIDLMQYTGFKDCNGNEIYEKDILDNGSVVCFDEKQGKWKAVPFSTYHCNAGLGGWTGYELHSHKSAVIGNIYENPELLTKE